MLCDEHRKKSIVISNSKFFLKTPLTGIGTISYKLLVYLLIIIITDPGVPVIFYNISY